MTEAVKENWGASDAYESYVGRWSRKIAPEFLSWLALPEGLAWSEVGCGTGALAEATLKAYAPLAVTGIDKSEGFVAESRRRIADPRARFENGDAMMLPWESATFDATVSGLTLNFVSDHEKMAREMVRVTKPSGTVAAYVWDYAGGMEMICRFWEAAMEVSQNDAKLKQSERFPICQPKPLQELFERVGLRSVSVRAFDVSTVFQNFDDYWNPFLGKQGSAPTYLASVSDDVRERIQEILRGRLTPGGDGSINLTARAWAVKGTV